MKLNIINKLKGAAFFLALSFFVTSCDEAFLDEVPKDFLSPENSYTNLAGFETAITGLHVIARDFYCETDGPNFYILPALGTDLAVDGENLQSGRQMDYTTISATNENMKSNWDRAFKMIKNANVIITRAESDKAYWKTPTEKLQIVAEARFFRAWAYRLLAEVFGGVPIIESEITKPKVDFVRNSREDVYKFIKTDLEFAAANLPTVDAEKADGRITQGAAFHLLAEINICLKDWDGAIAAASSVINNPKYKLMTSRFGTRKSVAGADVYWDLFQLGNQNRKSGNTETIWAVQFDYKTPGGGSYGGPEFGWTQGYTIERAWIPRYFDTKVKQLILTDTLGRGVGWCMPTNYLQQEIWQSDFNDMRNSEANIKRNYYYNDPNFPETFGKLIPTSAFNDAELFQLYPAFMKTTSTYNHPDNIINTGRIFRDVYVFRLAETYLLRAEAYLGKERTDLAADDINVLRTRANATNIGAGDVTIDYILDERARELYTEEFRTLTLTRLGLLYDRVTRFSKILERDGSVVASKPSTTIQPFNNLWPIPQTAIDMNTGAKLEQNPGYN